MACKESIGFKIKKLRKSKDITQEKFAEVIDISTRQMIKIENGEVYPAIDVLQKIAKFFDIPIIYFFEDENFDKYYYKYEYIKKKLHEKIDEINEQNLRILYFISENMI